MVSNLSFEKLLGRIKPVHFFELLKLLLLERKILIVQNDDFCLAAIIECLIRLLYPLYFSHLINFNNSLANGTS